MNNQQQARAPNGNGGTRQASPPSNGKPARIPLGAFYQRTDHRGRRYLSGRLGLVKIILFETQETSRGDVVWEAVILEGNYASDEQRALAAQMEEAQP